MRMDGTLGGRDRPVLGAMGAESQKCVSESPVIGDKQ